MRCGGLSNIPNPESRYTLGEILGQGAFGKVYSARDTQASGKKVAIKMQKYDKEGKTYVEEEYNILKELGDCMYIVGFYGIFRVEDEIWLVLENCEGNTAIDLVTGLSQQNRRLCEEHIAYILKEVVKAIVYLHENNIIHRDIKGSNVLLTKEGDVKLCDFGLARKLNDVDEKLYECIGSPCWMAPEVVTAHNREPGESRFYDNRVDVWALGITAIELAEGSAPFQSMHPSRALFQITKNPPPRLAKMSNWTEQFHDFISECLVKYFEHRPYIMEVIEHPFLQNIPENNYHLTLELKKLLEDVSTSPIRDKCTEAVIIGKHFKRSMENQLERIVEEDLADLDCIDEQSVLGLLEERFNNEQFYTFIGDILLSVNPNKKPEIYGSKFHQRYFQKSRSDNAPHIYAVADTAYQNALHHKIPQQIVLTGESASGKTTNYFQVIEHLFFIGEQHPVSVFRIKNGIKLIHALTHASTPTNNYSTRCALKTNLCFGPTGKLTAATFKALCLEKWRISVVDMHQSNFHILYYIYDGLVHTDALKKYKLHSRRSYRYLRVPTDNANDCNKPRDNVEQNVIKYKKIFSYLEEFEFSEEQITTFFSVMAAILNLGEIRFRENDDNSAALETDEHATNFCHLMEIEENKFIWALTNYCLAKKGNVVRKRNTCDEARNSRDVLANNLYSRFVDYIVGTINTKLEIGKAIFGHKYTVNILDLFGFECFKQNHLPQFFVNSLNEQLQYHYLQRIFAWEIKDLQTEELEFEPIGYFDNRRTLNQLLSKPEGVLCVIDDAAKRNLGGQYVVSRLENQESNRVRVTDDVEFSVAHYTGVVLYNVKEMADKNRDFLAPELVETMRESENPVLRMLFSNKLDRTGNLILNFDRIKRGRFGVAVKMTAGVNQFSQIKNARTAGNVFRCLCLELLRELSIGGSSGGTHFVRCIRSDLKGKPGHFNKELMKQQVRALAVVETARMRQKGFPHRTSFPEFLRRYKFLAFDFDENVDVTRDNCRLLLIRLKMEGWAIGKSQVFLKYYHEEYLSRLYDTHVRKIIKIQSILRAFLTKCRLKKSVKDEEKSCIEEMRRRRRSSVMTQEEAAEIIQKAYRKSAMRHKGLAHDFEPLTDKDRKLVLPYAKKWKSHSVYHVLMQYRAVKLYDFFNFSQQVHLYNQYCFFQTQKVQVAVDLAAIDETAQANLWLGEIKPVVLKVTFRLDEIPFYDTSALCDALTNIGDAIGDECWDSPYRWRLCQSHEDNHSTHKPENRPDLLSIPYNRDPEEPLATLPVSISDEKLNEESQSTNKDSEPTITSPIDKSIQCNGQESFKDKQEIFASIQLRKTDNKLRYDQHESTYNSTPANKDFEFIKSSHFTSKPKDVDPIAELRSKVQRKNSTFEDDPPFNFQGMLRKTNFQRDSVRKASGTRRDSLKNAALEAVRRFSLPKDKDEHVEEVKGKHKEEITVLNSRAVFMELIPGLILEGVEVDL